VGDVPPGGVVLSDQTVVLTRSMDDVVRGFSATCSHQGCLLALGSTESIDCSCQCSRFDPATGEVLAGRLAARYHL
jgi:nitrite reductase/ring-hydroxylating ferredoxin subunit